MEIKRLLVGVPSFDYMHTDFVQSLIGLLNRLRDEKIEHQLFICSGTLAHVARDKIAKMAVNQGFSHVLWLDADMVFQPTILEDLAFSGEKFVTGIAAARRPPHCMCIFRNLDINHLDRYEPDEMPNEPFRIAGCGFACVLIETEILEAVLHHFKTCFLPSADYGEDLAFCLRATQMGYKIWADPSVRLGHIGHITIWPEDHEKYMNNLVKGG